MLNAIPHFDQWLGIWAIREEDFLSGYQWFQGLDLHLHLQSGPSQAARQAHDEQRPDIRDGVEVIGLHGSLMKQQASLSRSTSTVMTRRKIRAAVRNPDVAAILLHIESPGGTAAGTKELADDVAEAAKSKPVYAFIEDLGASAAYWIASQATKVFANPTAIVGSIGTYGVVYDYSAMAAKEGIKAHVIRAGEFKGAFTPGTEVTAEQLAEQQKIVTDLNEFFIRGVKAGRRLTLEQTRKLADGRVHVGQAAVEQSLIDAVQSLDETFTQLAAAGRKKRSPAMSVDINADTSPITPESAAPATPAPASVAATLKLPGPATLAELKAAFPKANNDFFVSQLEANATVAQAKDAWSAKLAADVERLTQENTQLKADKPVAKTASAADEPAPLVSAGVTGSSTTATGGDAIAQWEEQLQTLMDDRKLTKAQAARKLAIDNPQLQAAYCAAYTQLHGAKVNPAGNRK
jgi:signal peptide peptidase SppA